MFKVRGRPASLVDLYAENARPASLFICLNGPSLADVDLAALDVPGALVMGVNNGAHLVRPDLWVSVDTPARFMASIWTDPRILKFVPAGHADQPIWNHQAQSFGRRSGDCPGVVHWTVGTKIRPAAWLSEPVVTYGDDRRKIFSVMLAALKVAYVLGFRRVFLLGCDFNMDAARPYFFEEDRDQATAAANNRLYSVVRTYFRSLRPWFNRAGFQVYNSTPGSGLDVFPFRSLERALESVAIDAETGTRGMYVPGRRQ